LFPNSAEAGTTDRPRSGRNRVGLRGSTRGHRVGGDLSEVRRGNRADFDCGRSCL